VAELYTGADSLRWFLTGASAAGGAQGNPRLSLGGYRSSRVVDSLTAVRYQAIRGLSLLYVSGYNGQGLGTLMADSAGSLRWTAPLASEPGESVAIADGETKVIPGADADQYVVVRRTTDADLLGTETVQLTDTLNNLVGGSNFSSAERTAGTYKQRAAILKNCAAYALTGLKFWLDPDLASEFRIGIVALSVGALELLSSETSFPEGVSWSTATTPETGLSLASLAAGAEYGLWMSRHAGSSTPATAKLTNAIRYRFVENGVTHNGSLRGAGRIANDALIGKLVYLGVDAEPVIGGTPYATFTGNSHETAALDVGHVYRFATVPRNAWGLIGPVKKIGVVRLLADGSEGADPPNGPAIVDARAAADGKVTVTAVYHPRSEGQTNEEILAKRGDAWLFYVRGDGTEPDPETDTPVVVAMQSARLLLADEKVVWTTPDAYADRAPVRVLVKVRRTAAVPIAEIVRNGSTARAYAAGHGLTTGDSVTIAGANQSEYNGTFTVTVVDPVLFTYTVSGTPVSPATGTITATPAGAQDVDSENTESALATVDYDGPGRPAATVTQGRAYGLQAEPSTIDPVTTVINAGDNVRWVQGPGYTQLWADTVLVFNLRYDSGDADTNGLYTTLAFSDTEPSGAAASTVEYAAGPPKVVYLSVAGVRRLKMDLTAGQMFAARLDDSGVGPDSRQAAPAWGRFADTCIQVWDPTAQEWATGARIESDGTLTLWVPYRDKATQEECLS
jgi:hypothetical protein